MYQATTLLSVPDPSKNYTEIIKNQIVINKVIAKLELNKPPDQLTPERLIKLITVEPIQGTNQVSTIVTYTNPEKARDIANAVVTSVVELNEDVNEKETMEAIKNRDSIRNRMNEIDFQMFQVKQEQILAQDIAETVRQKKEILLQERRKIEFELLEIDRTIEEKNAVINALAKKLGEEKKIILLSRSLINDSVLQDVIKEASNLPTSILSGLQIKDEQINPLYLTMEPKLIEALSNLEGLKVRKIVLTKDLEDNEKQLMALQKEWVEKELNLWNLTRHYNSLEEDFKSIKGKLDQAQALVEAKKSRLEIVDLAVTPKAPIKTGGRVNLLLAGAIGFFASLVILVFLLEYVTPAVKAERQSNLV
jgi:capsular polysaccharide biosynthesis protein